MPEITALFDSDLGYVVLLFALFVIPCVLQRWRLPTAITSFIVALSLFAGLEVEVHEL